MGDIGVVIEIRRVIRIVIMQLNFTCFHSFSL